MNRLKLVRRVCEVLSKAGFYVSDPDLFRTVNFDIVARRDNLLLIIKVLVNVDAFNKEVSDQMRIVASFMDGAPLLVGARSSTNTLQPDTIYVRHGIPIMSFDTMVDYFIEGVPPFIFAAPGGPYVRIDGEELKKARTEKNISLGQLAEAAGVSRKAIQHYESGMNAIVDVAARMEDYLNTPIVSPIDPFELVVPPPKPINIPGNLPGFERDIYKKLRSIGFTVVPTAKCPFDALSGLEEVKREILMTGIGKQNKSAIKKAKVMGELSKISEKSSVLVLGTSPGRQNIGGTPVIGRKELIKLQGADEVIELVKEREK
jgi:putative transcriptional regulator